MFRISLLATAFVAIATSVHTTTVSHRVLCLPDDTNIHSNLPIHYVVGEHEYEAQEDTQEEMEPIEEEPIYYSVKLDPVYGELRPVTVHCEDWELEELSRLAYLEAGADCVSDECLRAVVEVVFNQLMYGRWGSTLHEVIYYPNNYEPACYINVTEPSARCREIVRQVYEEGCRIPQRVMFFRAWYYHQWHGAIAEFQIDNVCFSSSWWCQ